VSVVPGIFLANGQWSARAATLSLLLRSAYGLPSSRIVGSMPAWTRSERFDIISTPLPDRSLNELQAAAQQVLANRFGMRTHWEPRDVEVYALVRVSGTRLGTGLRASQRACDRTNGSADLPKGNPCAESFARGDGGTMRLQLRDRPVADLLPLTGARIDIGEPVVDRTGLDGRFDMDLEFAPSSSLALSSAVIGVPLASAVQDQLGLRFEKRQERVDVLVVEQVSRPSAD
jgi:uncharacterized protein (TIGR03435 family)